MKGEIPMNYQHEALLKAVVAMRAFTDPEGNMPADTGEFRDLKAALSDAEAALLTMPDDPLFADSAIPSGPVLHAPSGAVFDEVLTAAFPSDLLALTPQADHQCCGKCEKPADLPPVHAAIDPEQMTATPEQYMAAIQDLAQRLQTADAVIIALVQAAGGEVTIAGEDSAKVIGHQIVSEVSEDRTAFTFRAVPVEQQVVQ